MSCCKVGAWNHFHPYVILLHVPARSLAPYCISTEFGWGARVEMRRFLQAPLDKSCWVFGVVVFQVCKSFGKFVYLGCSKFNFYPRIGVNQSAILLWECTRSVQGHTQLQSQDYGKKKVEIVDSTDYKGLGSHGQRSYLQKHVSMASIEERGWDITRIAMVAPRRIIAYCWKCTLYAPELVQKIFICTDISINPFQ